MKKLEKKIKYGDSLYLNLRRVKLSKNCEKYQQKGQYPCNFCKVIVKTKF